jgi:protoheme IX farnesyltransferase
MKTAVLTADPVILTRSRALDYLALTKPRIAVLVLFTVGAGVLLAGGAAVSLALLLHTVVGTALVAGGASALNQLLERQTDARMRRTENRPLPAGRLLPVEVLLFGLLLAVGGVVYLLVLSRPLAALVATITCILYVGVYTPLKRCTTLNTLIGAVPGALPPVIGWTAVRGVFDAEAWTLFFIVFLWQVPHFLAIAWMYRDQYARAGLCMLPVLDRNGSQTSWRMISYCLGLIPVSLAPVALGHAGWFYLAGALVLGTAFLASAFAFWRHRGQSRARLVLRASLLYLPLLLLFLLVDRALLGLP